MIPQVQDDLKQDFTFTTLPSRTFKMRHDTKTITGTIDEVRAVEQAVFLILNAQLAWYTHSEVRTEELQTHECTPHKTLRPFTHAQLGGLENKSIRKEMTDGTVHT